MVMKFSTDIHVCDFGDPLTPLSFVNYRVSYG